MNVFITGIRGFIAGHLSLFLQDQGYTVSGSTSRTGEPMGSQPVGERISHHKLGEPVDEAMFDGMDVVIHCAHDFQKGALRKNIEGTIALAEAADKQVLANRYLSALFLRAPMPKANTEKPNLKLNSISKETRGSSSGRGPFWAVGVFSEKWSVGEEVPRWFPCLTAAILKCI